LKIVGGRAGFHSVSFTGEKYESISKLKNGKITTEIRQKKEHMKIVDILSKIPFIRAYAMFFEIIIRFWKLYLFTLIALLVLESFFNEKGNVSFLHNINMNTSVVVLSFLIIASFIIKLTPIGKYHAAEHMVAHAYGKYPSLTLEEVKKQPRIHKDCGTNLVISVLTCFFLLKMVFGDATWVFIVSWSIGYELWKNEPKLLWDAILAIGKAIQYLFFTSKPEEKHLLVAMEAMKKLEEEECANL